MIPKRKARDDETAEKFAKLHDAEAERSAATAELKTHTGKYSVEDAKQALERSQEGAVEPGSLDVNTIHPEPEIHEQIYMTKGYGTLCTTTSTFSLTLSAL